MNTTNNFKGQVREAMLAARAHFDGTDANFAKRMGISASAFSRIKAGELERIISEAQWLSIGRRLDVQPRSRRWNVAQTAVFRQIAGEVEFCQQHSKSRMYVDDCGIGKTFAAKYLARNLRNCFYLDASQCKSRTKFVRALAGVLGVDANGYMPEVLDNIKYYLTTLPQPIVIIDEAGDLEYRAFLEIKALWNATEGCCGWYMIGADGLQAKIERGIQCRKVGYREIFSRFSERFSSTVPVDRDQRTAFYRQLITEVIQANAAEGVDVADIVRRSMIKVDGRMGGLRRAESLLLIEAEAHGQRSATAKGQGHGRG